MVKGAADERSFVSVVIPALNAASTLPRQLAALASQVDAPAFEVVVVDNGSEDRTRAVIADWTGRIDVRLVDGSATRGASFARNIGAAAAEGDRLLFCDADDVVSPHWVALMSGALESGRVLVAGPIVQVSEETPVGWIPPDPRYGADPANYMGLMPCVLAGSLAIWRDDYIALGGYDNSYRGGCEDVDFSWRAQLNGLEVVVATGCYLYYTPRRSSLAVFRQHRRYGSQGILLWVRFRDQPGIGGPSLKWTLGALVRGILSFRPTFLHDHRRRYEWAQGLAANIGSLEGHVRYRILKRVPKRHLGGVSHTWHGIPGSFR